MTTLRVSSLTLHVAMAGLYCLVGVSTGIAALRGDLDGNGTRDLTDVRIMIYMLLGQQAKTPEADLDGDGQVRLSDLQALATRSATEEAHRITRRGGPDTQLTFTSIALGLTFSAFGR